MLGSMLYRVIKGLLKIVILVFYRLEIEGQEKIPQQGSLIVAANHVSYMDPPVLGSAINRQVHFMAKEELFKNPIMNWIYHQIGTFPVKRGKADRKAIKRALELLRDDKVLGLFPEGSRGTKDVQLGVVMMAQKTGAPILPVALLNTNRKEARGPIKVRIGTPIQFEKRGRLSRKEKQELAEEVMDRIYTLYNG